jgi:hypothetical protein
VAVRGARVRLLRCTIEPWSADNVAWQGIRASELSDSCQFYTAAAQGTFRSRPPPETAARMAANARQ